MTTQEPEKVKEKNYCLIYIAHLVDCPFLFWCMACPHCGVSCTTKAISTIGNEERKKLPKIFDKKIRIIEIHIKAQIHILFYNQGEQRWASTPCLVKKPLSPYDLEMRVVVSYVSQHMPFKWHDRGFHSESIRPRNFEIVKCLEGVVTTCSKIMLMEQQKMMPRRFSHVTVEEKTQWGGVVNDLGVMEFVNFSIRTFEMVLNTKGAGTVGHIDVQQFVK